MRDFKDLIVWKKAHENALTVYKLTKFFLKEEQFGIISQLRRSSVSIPTNIAEGCGKFTQKDFANFLQISLGSSHEVEYLILLSFELKYLNNTDYENLNKQPMKLKQCLLRLSKKFANSSVFNLLAFNFMLSK